MSPLVCKACGKTFNPPADLAVDAREAFVEEESARCARLQDLHHQRQALAEKMNSGISGLLGTESLDTFDMVAQRKSLAQLDANLKSEEENLAKAMLHTPS